METPEELFNRNLPLAYHFLGKAGYPDHLADEARQGALMGLWHAAKNYDGRGEFSTYATPCIRRYIQKVVFKATFNKASEVRTQSPLFYTESLQALLEAGKDFSKEEQQADTEVIYTALDKLNAAEKYLIELRFGLNGVEEKTLEEIAADRSITKQAVFAKLKKILNKLKKLI